MFEAACTRALDLTAAIIDEYGPRLTGSRACQAGAARLAAAATGVCDSTTTEPFKVHPGAFLGFIRILVVLYILSLPLLVLLPWAAAAATSLGLAILVLEFFLYKEVIDPFYPAVEGLNVLGSLEPSGVVKRQVIVSGHHDSAHIFNFYLDRPELFSRRINGGIGIYAVLWLASLALAAAQGLGFGPALVARLALAILFTLGLGLLAPLWRFAAKEGTPGAGDNLAASAAALEITREFRRRRDEGKGLASTRILFVSFDAEEAGLRGARAFARKRAPEFAALPTFGYNMDCVYFLDKVSFLTSDLNGSVQLDAPASDLAVSVASAQGLPARTIPIAFLTGGTDAAELAKAGVRQTSLIAMDWSNSTRSAAYHTPADKVEAIEPAALESAIRIGVGFIEALETGRLG